jgi:hypothetical protein
MLEGEAINEGVVTGTHHGWRRLVDEVGATSSNCMGTTRDKTFSF